MKKTEYNIGRFGDYKQGLIVSGSQAAIYKAYDQVDRKFCIIKKSKPRHINRAQKEVEALKRLQGEGNVISMYHDEELESKELIIVLE